MRVRAKAAIALSASIGVGAVAAATITGAEAREIGRSNPEKAAYYRPPLFNFSETYKDGVVLGVAVGSARADAIRAAERGGYTVSPSGWGDNKAGGADLYERSELVAAMLRRPTLHFEAADDGKSGMTLDFSEDRVVAVHVHYINFEAI
jgi:hypothetical protein